MGQVAGTTPDTNRVHRLVVVYVVAGLLGWVYVELSWWWWRTQRRFNAMIPWDQPRWSLLPPPVGRAARRRGRARGRGRRAR